MDTFFSPEFLDDLLPFLEAVFVVGIFVVVFLAGFCFGRLVEKDSTDNICEDVVKALTAVEIRLLQKKLATILFEKGEYRGDSSEANGDLFVTRDPLMAEGGLQ